MVDSIKSLYFTKIIFNIVQEKTKLKIAKYNKNLQRTIDISLVNYKIFSGRNIILIISQNMKENIYIIKNGRVKDMMKRVILYMN